MKHQQETEDIVKEAMAWNKLSENGGHPNIIVILKTDILVDAGRQYFDMELCILNLEDYIKANVKQAYGPSRFFSPAAHDDKLGCFSMWKILEDIAKGLEFIHSHKVVHGDLKPQNGKILSLSVNPLSSPIAILKVEDWGFGCYFQGDIKTCEGYQEPTWNALSPSSRIVAT